jgi:hypothetical protein
MAVIPHYQGTVRYHAPGRTAMLHAVRTGALIDSGVLDANGHWDFAYPASLGPATATVIEGLNPGTWSASNVVAAGTYLDVPGFDGCVLKCVISGTTGATQPTMAANRLWGYHHRPWGCVSSANVMMQNGQKMWGDWVAATPRSGFDGHPNTWDMERIVDMQMAGHLIMALMDDGTINMSTGASQWYYAQTYSQFKVLTNIVAIWGSDAVAYAIDKDHVIYSGHCGSVMDQFLYDDDNPADPYHVCFGSGAFGEGVLVLTDGTAVGQQSGWAKLRPEINPGFVGLEIGAHHNPFQSSVSFIADQGQRYCGLAGNSVYFSHDAPPGDEFRLLYNFYFGQVAITRLGRTYTPTNRGGTESQYPGYYNHGDPRQIRTINDGCANTAVLSFGRTAATQAPPKGIDYRMEVMMDPATDRPFELHTHPILVDGSVVYHVLEDAVLSADIIGLTTADLDTGSADGTVSGTVTVNGVSAARPVIAISRDPVGDNRIVLAETVSAPDGSFTLRSPGYTEPVLVLALDNAGARWDALAIVAVGARTFPTADNHTGLVYECIAGGTTAASEPTWSTVIGETVTDAGVTWKAIEYYQPQAHGPVNPLVLGT